MIITSTTVLDSIFMRPDPQIIHSPYEIPKMENVRSINVDYGLQELVEFDIRTPQWDYALYCSKEMFEEWFNELPEESQMNVLMVGFAKRSFIKELNLRPKEGVYEKFAMARL